MLLASTHPYIVSSEARAWGIFSWISKIHWLLPFQYHLFAISILQSIAGSSILIIPCTLPTPSSPSSPPLPSLSHRTVHFGSRWMELNQGDRSSISIMAISHGTREHFSCILLNNHLHKNVTNSLTSRSHWHILSLTSMECTCRRMLHTIRKCSALPKENKSKTLQIFV